MLNKRIIGGTIVVFVVALAVILGNVATSVFVLILAITALYEFYRTISRAGYKPIGYVGYFFSTLLFVTEIVKGTTSYNFNGLDITEILLYLFIMSVFVIMIFTKGKYNILDVAFTVLGFLYIAFLFHFITLIRNMDNGEYLIWLLFAGVWGADTGAYFIGKIFGKRKIIPSLSPNKTVEGSIGGVAGAVFLTCLFGIIAGAAMSTLSIRDFILLGILSGIISQFGDWIASAIKRSTGVKDFGHILPGHGGVLDRFDSILTVAPIIYFYLNIVL